LTQQGEVATAHNEHVGCGSVDLYLNKRDGKVRTKDEDSPFHSSAGCRELTQSINSITTQRIELHCSRAQDARTNRTHTRLILRGQSNCNIDEWHHDADAVLPKSPSLLHVPLYLTKSTILQTTVCDLNKFARGGQNADVHLTTLSMTDKGTCSRRVLMKNGCLNDSPRSMKEAGRHHISPMSALVK
jgi:hypothetical protein